MVHQKSSPPLNQTTFAAKFVVVVGDKRVLEVKLEKVKLEEEKNRHRTCREDSTHHPDSSRAMGVVQDHRVDFAQIADAKGV